jgi:hypothetical protein
MERIKEKPKIDTSALDAVMDLKKADIERATNREPSTVIDTDLRLREGAGYKGDVIEVEGVKVVIPQLTFIQVRKANREGLKSLDGKPIGKKVLLAIRSEAKLDEQVGDSLEETAQIAEMTDIEDLWFMFYALVESKHPKVTGDFVKDRPYLERIKNAEELIKAIRRFNGLSSEGVEDVKFFRDDGLRITIKDGAGEAKVFPVHGDNDAKGNVPKVH